MVVLSGLGVGRGGFRVVLGVSGVVRRRFQEAFEDGFRWFWVAKS